MVQSEEGSFKRGSISERDWEMEEQYIRRLDVKIIGPAPRQLEVISLVSLQLLPGQANG